MEWGKRWEGFQDGGGQMYTCGQFMPMYGKSHHKIVSNYPQIKRNLINYKRNYNNKGNKKYKRK